MSLSLYTITQDLTQVLDQIDDDGVISDDLANQLALFDAKGLAVTAYILNCEAEAQLIKDAAAKMAKRAEGPSNKAKRLREYLVVSMKRTGITEISCPQFSAKLHLERDASVEVFDEKQLPADFMRYPEPKPPVAVPDKALITKAIKDGFDVPGAKIIKKDRLDIK